jgi:hypothetical protein
MLIIKKKYRSNIFFFIEEAQFNFFTGSDETEILQWITGTEKLK